MKFCGWVPTVTGHLSFNTIGNASFPTKSGVVRHGKKVCFCQTRDLLDVLVPYTEHSELGAFFREKIANHVVGISGKFTFLTHATVSPNGEQLSGNVYVVSDALKRDAARSLNSKIQLSDNDSIDECVSFVKEHSTANCVAHATFTLSRSGKIEIDCELTPADVDDDYGTVVRLLANQVFYYLKDMSHVHQHHDPSHDAITELTEHPDPDSHDWIKATQQSLYRAVIRYKRFRNEKALFRASGILAYAQSFEKSHLTDETKGHLKEFNRDELNASLEVSRAEIQHFDQKRLSRTESIRNSFFALFGFIISVTFLARMDESFSVELHPAITFATSLIAEKPLPTIGVVVLLSFVYSFATHKNDPAEFELTRATMRLLQGFQLRWNVIFNLLVTILLSWFCYLLLISELFN